MTRVLQSSSRVGRCDCRGRRKGGGHGRARAESSLSTFRPALVRRVQREIEAGTYETEARLDRAVDALLKRLGR